MDEVAIRPVAELDPVALLRHVVDAWQDESVVAHGERIHPARLPGFVATVGDEIVGHVSYRVDGRRCEVTSIEASPRHAGIGTRLLEAALEAARASGCRAAWLTTTNDNLEGLRFYQRRGFRLLALRPGAVDDARRTLKPSIPTMGSFGIQMRDEIDLQIDLEPIAETQEYAT